MWEQRSDRIFSDVKWAPMWAREDSEGATGNWEQQEKMNGENNDNITRDEDRNGSLCSSLGSRECRVSRGSRSNVSYLGVCGLVGVCYNRLGN
ncbi:unnamed protein product [Gordionus sp. m RMFG-2023]